MEKRGLIQIRFSKKDLSKKGLSNIVATILLILISIIAIVLVGSYIKNFLRNKQIEQSQLNLNCIQDVEIEILEACYNENLFKITVKNKKDIILGDFFLIIFYYSDGENEIIPTPYLTYIMPYETKIINVPYKKPTDKIIVVPRIEEQSFLCMNNAPEYSNIKECWAGE